MADNEVLPHSVHNGLRQFGGLLWWSLVRHRFLLPTFSVVQAGLAAAIVFGLSLLIPSPSPEAQCYLSSGAITIGIIAVGCVLAAQIVSTAKQEGLVTYQKTLPVSRTGLILADVLIWTIAALPGILVACLAAVVRFHVRLDVSPLSVGVMLLAQVAMILIGFSLAYWLPANLLSLATQVIMIGGLLFSPITFPADRLPAWLTACYQVLPFVPTSHLIRATLFHAGQLRMLDLIVLLAWAAGAFAASLTALTQRR